MAEDETWYEPGETYWCAFCNREIAHEGFDPVQLYIEAARGGQSWMTWAHALCVRDAYHPDFAHDIPREEYAPLGDANA